MTSSTSEKAVAWLAFTTGCLALTFGVPEWLRSAVRSARLGEWHADPDGKVVFDQEQNPFRRQGARLGAVLIHNKQWREEREQRAKERRKTKKAKFRRTVEAIVQDRFLEYEPKGSENAKQWRRHTERPRQDLIDDLTHRHWRTGAPGALDWLIQLRAKEIGGGTSTPRMCGSRRASDASGASARSSGSGCSPSPSSGSSRAGTPTTES